MYDRRTNASVIRLVDRSGDRHNAEWNNETLTISLESLNKELSNDSQPSINDPAEPLAGLVTKSVFGGILMGLANLVPGISGGTMLLAAGVYPKFVDGVAEVTTFRFRFRSLVVLGCVGVAAALGILMFAGLLKTLVVEQRWVMYSLFIGLTLGGLPVVYKLVKPLDGSAIISAIVAFAAMVIFAWLQFTNADGGGQTNWLLLLVAGLGGASAMILPGLSGGYILLLLGQYVPILDGVDEFKTALSNRDVSAAIEPALHVMLPVGIGVVIGVMAISNLLKWLLKNHRKSTLGFLIGLLLGSVIGLFPFQQSYQPKFGQKVKGRIVTPENIHEIEQDDWPTNVFAPDGFQVVASIGIVAVGFGITVGVARIGGRSDNNDEQSEH